MKFQYEFLVIRKVVLELTTPKWAQWFNHNRLLDPVGFIPQTEAEAQIIGSLQGNFWVSDSPQTAFSQPGAIHKRVST